jgi:23S rRNA (pseudouridine1915-N3)-methyltransferase
MRLTVCAVGTRVPGWVEEGVKTYRKRLPRHLELNFREVPAPRRSSGTTAARQKQQEGELIMKALPAQAYVIALDEHGSNWTSSELARQLEDWQGSHAIVAFMIGGADGLSDSCKQRADRLWSLSSLTLPHALVRVLLTEQLYRAWTVTQGHPYHRE